ncbi:hypothetical protein NP493_1002g00025 [Ridgeia piscesae]|uniref:Uncharacterized protein n=1 Tax=Ridgeia piscesae TaxID=27915 RepID=A0AAD9KIV0_RIDPI|nr:hypothetical protein NP493_1002g00025 [Ridgeia piscesae]
MEVAGLTVLLAWAGFVRGISKDDAIQKLYGCQSKCVKTYRECCDNSLARWRVCHDLYVWCDRYCQTMFDRTVTT